MGIKDMPARLDRLPTFTYTRAAKEAVTRHAGGTKQRRTVQKAVSIYKGRKRYTRLINRNMVDLARWKGENKPSGYPPGLRYPEDILKAALYGSKDSEVKDDENNKPSKKCKKGASKRFKACQILKEYCASCGGIAETSDKLCTCTDAPWDAHSSEAWREQNIELRWLSDDVGIGTYALIPFTKGTVLGEYIGELVHNEDCNSRYLFNVCDDAKQPLACLDSLRVGNWTRFINHSCNSNTEFEQMRVGEQVRFVATARRDICAEQEITVDYGKEYWKVMVEKGIRCVCGERKCKYGGKAMTTPMRRRGRLRDRRV